MVEATADAAVDNVTELFDTGRSEWIKYDN